MTSVFTPMCALIAASYAAGIGPTPVVTSPTTSVIGPTQGYPTPSYVQCHGDSDCGVGQCCIRSFMGRSKKRQFSPPHFIATCKSYLQLNEGCRYDMIMSGECGCAPGLYCARIPPPDIYLPPTTQGAPTRGPVIGHRDR